MRRGSEGALLLTMAENQVAVNQPQKPVSGLQLLTQKLNSDTIQKKFADMLGKKSVGFLASVSNVVTNNSLLRNADPNSIILAAAQAAALDLPINPNLGYAAIVPYDGKAQFQLMRDGFVELALRTGQIVSLVNEVVYEGELVRQNRFRDEYEFDESKRTSNKVIGYMAYAQLANGFEKTVYWDVERVKAHGMKYSKTFKNSKSLWVTDFDNMGLKTVLKYLIKKYLPKSIEMMRAVEYDGATVGGTIDAPIANYVDNADAQNVDYEEVINIDEVQEEAIGAVNGKKPHKQNTTAEIADDF
jgi:recombination protein RecT